MRVESAGAYLLIPVWDFYGYTEAMDQDGNEFSFAATQPNAAYTEYGKKGEEEFPLLTAIGSFLLLAAMFTPAYYAMSNAGPYRLWNIIFFLFYLLLMANLYYLAGWGKRRFPNAYQKTLAFFDRGKRFAPAYLLVAVCASVMLSGVGPSLGIQRESPTSVQAAAALRDGSAKAYAEAFDAQVALIADSDQELITLNPIPAPDAILPDGDITRYLAISREPSRWFGRELTAAQSPAE